MSTNHNQSDLPVIFLAPDADRWDTDPATDIVNMSDYARCDFYITEGVGGTGTTKLIVRSSDDVSASNTTDLAFRYRVAQTGDTFGDWTDIAATGYTLVAGANKMVQIQIDADQLAAGEPYVYMTTTEVDDGAVDANIMGILSGPRYASEGPATALT